MKVPKQKTSFGMPEELKQAQKEFLENREKEEEEAKNEAEAPVKDMSEGFDLSGDGNKDQEFNPNLKDLGVEITPEDINSLILFNNFEKTVTVYKCEITDKEFSVTFKSLSAEEFGHADSLLIDELDGNGVKATADGVRERRSLWTLAFAVIKINGKSLVSPVKDENDNVDVIATAKLSQKALRRMNPLILDKMSRINARLTLACRAVIENPSSPLLKRP